MPWWYHNQLGKYKVVGETPKKFWLASYHRAELWSTLYDPRWRKKCLILMDFTLFTSILENIEVIFVSVFYRFECFLC